MKSVLILDDEQANIDMLTLIMKTKFATSKIVGTRYPTQAKLLAEAHCFDMILLDVTLEYNGSPFGGLEIYAELANRYGTSSLLAYSSYITDDLLKKYHFPFNFIERSPDGAKWIETIQTTLTGLRASQSCFVVMPFDRKHDPLFKIISDCVEKAGYRCLRIDRQVFTKSIVQKIFDEIKAAKLIIFVATDQNPNVYFEAGYAIALGKEVVSLTDSFANLPFDIRDRNAICYEPDLTTLDDLLSKRLAGLTDFT